VTAARRSLPPWYAVFYAACITAMSIMTMADAESLADHRAWLPAIEIIGVILLLVQRTRMAGMVVLLAVYGFAAIHAIHTGHVPIDLLLYAGTAVFIARLPAFPTAGDGSSRGSGI
jgi:hypothetical protein